MLPFLNYFISPEPKNKSQIPNHKTQTNPFLKSSSLERI